MEVTIREALPDDSEKILAYLDELSREGDVDILLTPGELSHTIEEERKIIADFASAPNSVFLLAVHGDEIIGVLTSRGFTRKKIRHCTNLGMSVHKDYRDMKIGHALMNALITWARQSGVVKRIELSAFSRNSRAIHLYEKFGFVKEGLRRKSINDNGDYLDDVLMGLVL
jgi:RimJ/RimL family protein N-acetyltransferase